MGIPVCKLFSNHAFSVLLTNEGTDDTSTMEKVDLRIYTASADSENVSCENISAH